MDHYIRDRSSWRPAATVPRSVSILLTKSIPCRTQIDDLNDIILITDEFVILESDASVVLAIFNATPAFFNVVRCHEANLQSSHP